MKRVITHPEEPKTGKRFWRSLSERARTPEFQNKLDREFLDGQAEMKSEEDAEQSRRSFLKIMGASTALAGMAACRRPEIFIKPYAKAPEWIIPGKALYYATAMPRDGGAVPMVVTSYEGRPTHLAGNSLHAESNGGLDVQAQASVLNLFDPERNKTVLHEGKAVEKAVFVKALEEKTKAWAGNGGKGVALLLDNAGGPTRNRLVADLQKKLPALKVYQYEPLAAKGAADATSAAFGPGTVLSYDFDKADKVLSLDADFMGLDRVGNNSTSLFMKGRKAENPGDPMNRLYVAEANYSLTGGMADHRLRLAPSQIFKAAAIIAKELGIAAPAVDENLGHPDAPVWLKTAAKDLVASKGKALVVAGNQQPKEVHLLVAAINNALGAYGTTISALQGEASKADSLADLTRALQAKEVTTVVAVLESNPVYDAPADLKFGEALKNGELILLSTRAKTHTARAATWLVPGTHYLEQWGDARSTTGVYSIVQPLILPLYETALSDIELVDALMPRTEEEAKKRKELEVEGYAGHAHSAVKATFDTICKAAKKEDAWNFALRDGFLPDSGFAKATAAFNAGSLAAAASFKAAEAPTPEKLEVVLAACGKIHDGRFVNNGWLQEAPDPVSKVTWDNAALVSLATAKRLGVTREYFTIDEDAAVIAVNVAGQTVKLPVVVIPGHAENTITVALGYGQGAESGEVAQGAGVNVYPLRSTASPYFLSGATAKTDGSVYQIALTQEHSAMYGRDLVREGTSDDWKENKDFVLEQGSDAHAQGTREQKNDKNQFSFYKPVARAKSGDPHASKNGSVNPGKSDVELNNVSLLNDELHQWGMVIDLNRCIGCSSCLVACQSENNIPIVGKDQVIRGREMHWIRMDRYFATDLNEEVLPEAVTFAGKLFGANTDVWDEDFTDEPEMVVQPVACQHCEAAPCETVCPVNATVHSPDGLNLMAYNRCIGTRYCANNCPFKARRFNFFDYNKRNPLTTKELPLVGKFGNLYAGPMGDRHDSELGKLQKNPNVSVRMRGVMEKCTYCIQRIESARIDTRAKARKNASVESGKFDETLMVDKEALRIKKDGVKTACQIACPADAIVFGNIAEGSKDTINTWKNNSRNYELLTYLGIKARTTYLGRIKNPNPEMFAIKWEKTKAGNATKYESHAHAGHAAPGDAHAVKAEGHKPAAH